MKKHEEKMSLTSKLILFVVLTMILFVIVVMEKESQERAAGVAGSKRGPVATKNDETYHTSDRADL